MQRPQMPPRGPEAMRPPSQMPAGMPSKLPPPPGMGEDADVGVDEKNAMIVGMAVMRGEIDLASLDPDIAEIVIRVLDKYHPEWRKQIQMKGASPMKPGMPPMSSGGGPMKAKPSNAPAGMSRPGMPRPGMSAPPAAGKAPMRPGMNNSAPGGAKPFGMK